MEKTWKHIVAGILDMISGAVGSGGWIRTNDLRVAGLKRNCRYLVYVIKPTPTANPIAFLNAILYDSVSS